MAQVFDVSGLVKLEHDLGKVPGKAVAAVTEVVEANTAALLAAWVVNARATSGTHGKLYPDSITAERKFSIGLTSLIGGEVGPDNSRPQGSMGKGFEYGSVNQPPHLDGNKAADLVEPLFTAALAKVAGDALGSL